jgi:predicted Zn-dependent protease with MMP-like domain
MGVLIAIRRLLGNTGTETDPTPCEADGQPATGDDPFAQLVADALDELPDEFLRALAHIPVIVSDGGADAGAYGLYRGAGTAHPDVGAQIIIFRDTLTRDFGEDRARIAAEVRRTVRHEVAHHLGYGERGVASLGL